MILPLIVSLRNNLEKTALPHVPHPNSIGEDARQMIIIPVVKRNDIFKIRVFILCMCSRIKVKHHPYTPKND